MKIFVLEWMPITGTTTRLYFVNETKATDYQAALVKAAAFIGSRLKPTVMGVTTEDEIIEPDPIPPEPEPEP